MVGAPVSGLQANSRGQLEGYTVPVPLIDNLNGGTVDTGHACFPTPQCWELDIPGVRGTWGLDLNGADMELSFFGMEQSSSDGGRRHQCGKSLCRAAHGAGVWHQLVPEYGRPLADRWKCSPVATWTL
jgi:hypothetical protein